MRFLVDAQLPRRLARWLAAQRCDAVHTLDLPSGNATADQELIELADLEDRIVVTKDDDFVQSFILSGRPARLWLVATGNIRNSDLEALISRHWDSIQVAWQGARFVELGDVGLIVHE